MGVADEERGADDDEEGNRYPEEDNRVPLPFGFLLRRDWMRGVHIAKLIGQYTPGSRKSQWTANAGPW